MMNAAPAAGAQPLAKELTQELTQELSWNRRHVIDSSVLSRAEIEDVMQTAQTFYDVLSRPIKKVPTLRGKVIVTMFYENSTRTRTSFELAGKYLSADTMNFSVSTSSVKKGESLNDTIETLLAMGTDAVVIRHGSSGICQQIVNTFGHRLCVLNGGDGFHDHPSQGLLDLFTMRTRIPDMEGKKVTIVGDVLHSRVARSNIHILKRCGVDVHIVAPATLLPREVEKLGCKVHTQIEPALDGADVVMALRLQLERQKSGLLPSLLDYSRLYGINHERLQRWCKPEVLVMHPGPMNRGVEITSAVADDPALSLIANQVTSGVAVRMALLYLVLGSSQSGSQPVS
jgi:aspartate carbamoyltransferase catalytic subunit